MDLDDPQTKVVNDAVEQSILRAGIPKQFARKSEQLRNYGLRGMALDDMFSSGEMSTLLAGGGGLYFEGDSPELFARFHLTCRGVLRRHLPLSVLSLPTFRQVVCGKNYDETISRVVVLAIGGFYDKTYKQPFSEEDLFTMGWYLREWVMSGKALILQGSLPLGRCDWWSDSLLQLLQTKLVTHK
jgi:hypothetical protein